MVKIDLPAKSRREFLAWGFREQDLALSYRTPSPSEPHPFQASAMRLQFDSQQPHQLRAVEAVADLFLGQARVSPHFGGSGSGDLFGPVGNRLGLPPEKVLHNLRAVQRRHNILESEKLEVIDEKVDFADGGKSAVFPNFSVEMETGTGKTYVYLRTALELHRRYGLRKFIVVVHSVAVREGVLKTLQVTRDHFRALYENVPYRYTSYDSKAISKVRQFALADSLEIMVMTVDSFNKDDNVIRQTRDQMQGAVPAPFDPGKTCGPSLSWMSRRTWRARAASARWPPFGR